MSDTVEKNIKINIDADIEPTLKNLRELKLQLKSAAAGSEEFRKIQEKIDDVQDSLKSAKTSAGSFVDILGTVPGPLGDISAKASTTIDLLKGFGKLKIGDIKASFTGLAGDIKDAGAGILKITGITKVYTFIQEGLASAFIKTGVAEGVAATGARVFAAALTATGIGALVVGLGLAISALMDFASSEDEVAEAVKSTNEALEAQKQIYNEIDGDRKRIQKVRLADLKANGATEAELRKQQIADAKDDIIEAADNQKKVERETYKGLAKIEGEYSDEAVAQREKLYAGLLEAQNKYQDSIANKQILEFENTLKNQQEADAAKKKAEDDAKKASEDAARAKEERYKKEVEANRQKWQKLIDDDVIAGKDTTENEVKLKEGLLAINKKYGKDTFDIAEEIRLKNAAADKKAKEDKLAFEKEVNDALVNTDIERRDQAIANEKEKFQKLLDNEKLSAEQRVALQTALQENIDKIISDYDKKQETDQKTKLQKEQDYQKTLAQIKEEALRVEYDDLEMQRQELRGIDKLFDDDGINAKIEYYNKLAILRDAEFERERQAIIDLATTTKEEEADKALKLQEIDKKIADNKKSIGDEIAKLEEDRNLLSLEKIQGYLATAQELTNAFGAFLDMQNADREQKTRESYDKQEEEALLAYKASIDNEAISDAEKLKIKTAYEASSKDLAYKRALQEYEDGKTSFENGKKLQYAQASIGIIQGGIQAFTSLAGIPVVGPILGGIAAAAVAAAGIIQLATISKASYSGKKPLPPVDDSAVGAGSGGSKFGQGGLLTGRKHAEGGIPTAFGELEGGEYVVNRQATEAFLPLLDKINGMGSGSGAPNNLSVAGEQAVAQPTPIIKTYVVATEVSSQQEANKRINDIARL
jgi:hypothetical protein